MVRPLYQYIDNNTTKYHKCFNIKHCDNKLKFQSHLGFVDTLVLKPHNFNEIRYSLVVVGYELATKKVKKFVGGQSKRVTLQFGDFE